MRHKPISYWGVLGLAACLHGAAHGQAGGAVPAPPASVAAPAPVSAAAAAAGQAATGPATQTVARGDDDALFGAPPLAAERLAQWRGGTDTVSNDMRLNGAVAGNTAINVATGANIITNGSFSNASGLPVAIQNSGANVLIQNATIINVQLQ